jgi:hypothetical protein
MAAHLRDGTGFVRELITKVTAQQWRMLYGYA